jgi:hypothetical protein
MKYIKQLLAIIVNFTTGLGFYGIGLIAVAIGLLSIGIDSIAYGFIGAFVYKNWETIVPHLLKAWEFVKAKVLGWVNG